ncbi:MAG: hypothetical protein A4E74_02316 [Syntrophus sp. PtaB.Bin075]|nr:MAG: hypothetical protein A4E74_02316 [Syntrophus sp. PtaB.Bin075]
MQLVIQQGNQGGIRQLLTDAPGQIRIVPDVNDHLRGHIQPPVMKSSYNYIIFHVPQKDHQEIVDIQTDKIAGGKSVVAPPDRDHFSCMIIDFFFMGIFSFHLIVGIQFFPGEIPPVIGVGMAFKPQFRPIVDLRNASDREKKGQGQFHDVRCFSIIARLPIENPGHETGRKIVVVQQGDKLIVVGVGSVAFQYACSNVVR